MAGPEEKSVGDVLTPAAVVQAKKIAPPIIPYPSRHARIRSTGGPEVDASLTLVRPRGGPQEARRRPGP